MLKKKHNIFVAGHKGLVGSAVVKLLKDNGYKKLITIDRKKLDLTIEQNVNSTYGPLIALRNGVTDASNNIEKTKKWYELSIENRIAVTGILSDGDKLIVEKAITLNLDPIHKLNQWKDKKTVTGDLKKGLLPLSSTMDWLYESFIHTLS